MANVYFCPKSQKLRAINYRVILTTLISIFCYLTGTEKVRAQDNVDQDWIFKNSKTLSELWELDEEHHRGTFLITSYKPIYFSLGKFSTNTNKNPQSEQRDNSLPQPIDLNVFETKFQLSMKTKVFYKVLWGKADVWAAYSQKAYWQIYNKELSRPFRETNYEPEIILNFPMNFTVLGFKGRMLGAAFVHESNGRSDPLSRSWNRLSFHAGFDKGPWQLIVKNWFRLGGSNDDNPEISDYIGRGEAQLIYDWGRQRLSAIGRHSLRLGEKNRGSLQLNYTFPIIKNFSGHVQVFNGYGESLIDYNHRQTTFGLGVSLIN
ncbi:MAG: phospholipase [Pseudozobellia sp.]|nr:phospholipase [Pseudozobellia sp.]MBG47809.1 phospholipase [Pseudozobellia sp.]|tara:strand:+ start:384601 stop:385557 length:957 start_codon:yes stop_codon:yes gene_type:complete